MIKIEKILKGSLDSIPSPSPSMKIQIMGRKVCFRALPDITSGPEVRQIFKIRTVRKPDIFLPGRRTLNPLENKKNK